MTKTTMETILEKLAMVTAVLTLAGCATVNIEQAVSETSDATSAFTQGQLQLSRTEQQSRERSQLGSDLLAKPLAMNDAVQMALSNSPALQTLLAQNWADMAQANQAGQIANPIFSFERNRFGSELELQRMLSFGLLDLLTLPQRQAISSHPAAQAKLQLSASVIEHVTQVRQAWVRAVAAPQRAQYAQQISVSARASAELARRMQHSLPQESSHHECHGP